MALPAGFVGVLDAAEQIGVSRTTVYTMLGRGELDARKIGRKLVISAESITHFLTNLPRAEIGKKAA